MMKFSASATGKLEATIHKIGREANIAGTLVERH
jgi:hypothetical protein